ncbi:hypothetical protein [Ktedonobacter racemifer]|nr:hypothetical protein [Ktedonobacter racemifer]
MNNRTRKTFIFLVCFLIVGIAIFGSVIGSQIANAATTSPSHPHAASSANGVTTNASTFKVTSIDMTVTPSTTSLWTCGSYIQVVYNAVFHVDSGPNGGTIVFSYTVNNGRSQTTEKLTILPGQRLSNFTFTWQGSLPYDHTYPEPGGVLVTSPNTLHSQMVMPAGKCR